MNKELSNHLTAWSKATANLKYGVQRVFHDVFVLASEGKTHLVYGSDYNGGFPCLVNTVGSMLTTGGGHGVPSSNFAEVVREFDSINRILKTEGVNTEVGKVSPMAAEIFLQYFAPIKEKPIEDAVNEATKNEAFAQNIPYREPSDDDLARDLIEAFMTEPPKDIAREAVIFTDSDGESLEVQHHKPHGS